MAGMNHCQCLQLLCMVVMILSTGSVEGPFSQSPDVTSPFRVGADDDTEEFWKQTAEFYRDYCGNACNLSLSSWSTGSCLPCFCDDACQVLGDCCPDVYAAVGYHALIENTMCAKASFGFTKTSKYIMVTRCPDDAETSLMLKCERQMTSHWDWARPVTDMKNFVTYRNRYCAHCHGATNLTRWDLKITIEDPASIAGVTSSRELYQTVQMDEYNQIVYAYPRILEDHVRKCEHAVSQCNETGDWAVYDVSVERACRLLTAPITYRSVKYKNPFCYLCNTWKTWTWILMETPEPPGIESRDDTELPLLILLDFDDDDGKDDDVGLLSHELQRNDATHNCSAHHFFDSHTNSCRSIVCSPGKQQKADSDDYCQSSPKFSNVYGYKICFHGKTVKESRQTVFEWRGKLFLVNDRVTGILSSNHLLQDVIFAGGDVFSFYNNETGIENNLYVLDMFSRKPINRDVVDEAMLSSLSNFLNAFRSILESSEVEVSPTCSPLVFQSLTSDQPPDVQRPVPQWSFPTFKDAQHEKLYFMSVYLPLLRPLICPSVELNRGEFRYDATTSELVIECDNCSADGRVGVPYFYITESNTSLVCLSEYRKAVLKRTENGTSPSKLSSVLYWVSLFSTIVSLLFLFVSFVIYYLLPSLRTIAGINNLILIVALFGAQLLLQIGSDVSMVDWLCQIVGMTTHYFWLTVVFAQNVCTFHMFYTLSFPLLSHAALANPGLMVKRYVTYAFVMPAAFVAVTLAWQWGAEDRSGYGGAGCYISKALVRILMFAAPLGCTVMINLIMFVVTIVRLRTLQRVDSTHSNRVSLVLHTKLSVFTGLTWVFGFLASFLGSVPLAYVFALSQGCQGLFVFLAFLANRRVMEMLAERRGNVRSKSMTGSKGSAHTTSNPRGQGVSTNTTTFQTCAQDTAVGNDDVILTCKD